jgi:chromosome partitioning protein
MRRYIVLNSKGGCGKTTVATNLASLLAVNGYRVTLIDHDPQGSSMHWLEKRGDLLSPVHGVAAYASPAGMTRSFQMRVPGDHDCVIVDTPASLKRMDLDLLLRGADAVLVPLLPSAIDLHVTGHFLASLAGLLRSAGRPLRVGVIANRTRRNTRAFEELCNSVRRWNLPLIATLRDTLHYPAAASMGLGIHELRGTAMRKDRSEWAGVMDWLQPDPLPVPQDVARATAHAG